MSTTWKSLSAGFVAGFVSAFSFFVLHSLAIGVVLTLASLGYIAYQYFESEHSAH